MNFRLLWLGYTLSAFGDFVVPAALALAVVRATGSASALALVLACASVPRLVLLPIGGVLADRWSPRTVAIVADVVRAVVQLVIGVELVSGAFRLTDIAVASAIAGAASAFALPTGGPLVTATVPTARRPRANGLLGVSRGAAGVLGPAVGGTLVLTIGPGWAFLVDAATFVVSGIALSLVRVRFAPESRAAPLPLVSSLVEGWSELRRHDWLWTSLIAHGTWNLSAAVLATLGPLVAVHRAGGEAVWVAVAQAGAIGLLLGSLLATRVGAPGRFGIRPRRPVLWANLSLSLYAVPLALFAVPASAPWLVVTYGLALATLGFLNPVWESVVQQHVAPAKLARVNSWDMLISFAAMPLGYALAPVASSALGGDTVPLLVAAVLVAVAMTGTLFAPGVRNLTLRTDGGAGMPPITEPTPATDPAAVGRPRTATPETVGR
ncbi:MFS transporter [Asanoa sp. NPDC049573]|uniref:MFS transporter n=1 Tax=Asanoa sp. NPDC049573 TaxID=3155396 RepID=UPI0034330E8B